MKNVLIQFFTWWNGQTLGTRLWTWRTGTKVGEDGAGNIYYEGGVDTVVALASKVNSVLNRTPSAASQASVAGASASS